MENDGVSSSLLYENEPPQLAFNSFKKALVFENICSVSPGKPVRNVVLIAASGKTALIEETRFKYSTLEPILFIFFMRLSSPD